MPSEIATPNKVNGDGGGSGTPEEVKGMDIFNHVPEATAGREPNLIPDAAKPDAAPEKTDAPAAEEADKTVEGEDKNKPEVTTGAELPPETPPAWAQAMIEQAVAKVRTEELEPIKRELHTLKSEEGRVHKEEDEALIAEATQHQEAFNQQLKQTNTGIGLALINLVRNLQNVTEDAQGNLVVDVNGVPTPVDASEVGAFLLNAVSTNQGLMHQWGEGLQRITTKVEAVLFKRKPDFAQYKGQFDAKASQIYGAMYLDQVKADPHRVELVYEMIHNAAVAQELPSVRDKAVAAAREELKKKGGAGAPQRGGGRPAPKDAGADKSEEARAHQSLGLSPPSPSNRFGAPAVSQTPGRAKVI